MHDIIASWCDSLEREWKFTKRALERLAAAAKPKKNFIESIYNQWWDSNGAPNGSLEPIKDIRDQLANPSPPTVDQLLTILDAQFTTLRTNADRELNKLKGLVYDQTVLKSPFTRYADEVAACEEAFRDLEQLISLRHRELLFLDSKVGERLSLNGIRRSVEDLGAFPVLTSGVDVSPAPRTGFDGGRSPAAGAGSLIDAAFRRVLGRKPSLTDTRSFVAALEASFQVRQVQGATQVTWRPRAFAGQAELGGKVTGAQANLHALAAARLEPTITLLDNLEPLGFAVDREDMGAIRAVIKSDLEELVGELNVEGGPRGPRVEDLFERLVGDAKQIGQTVESGHLSDLKKRFSIDQKQVQTTDEEVVYANYLAIVDYVLQIRASWEAFKTTFLGKDLGTRLVLLSRALGVAAEAVEEVRTAMDSVFVGQAERQVATFFHDDSSNQLSVEELLEWIASFTSKEAPKLVTEGGRRAAASVKRTASVLETLVEKLLSSVGTDPGLPNGLRHPRVLRPLEELAGYLGSVERLAGEVHR